MVGIEKNKLYFTKGLKIQALVLDLPKNGMYASAF
jgi:hypothetical protein